MLAIIFDIGGGYLAATYVRNLWLLIAVAVFIGAASSISANLLMYAIASDVVTPGETMVRIMGGFVWHPVITLVAAFIYRRKKSKKLALEAKPQEKSA